MGLKYKRRGLARGDGLFAFCGAGFLLLGVSIENLAFMDFCLLDQSSLSFVKGFCAGMKVTKILLWYLNEGIQDSLMLRLQC